MYRLICLLFCVSWAAGQLSQQCLDENVVLKQSEGYAAELLQLQLTVSTVDPANWCSFDDKDPDTNRLFCNTYYDSDIPNRVEEECVAVSDLFSGLYIHSGQRSL